MYYIKKNQTLRLLEILFSAKNILLLFICSIFCSFTLPSKTTQFNIELLNGKWSKPCHEYINIPGKVECPSFIAYSMIQVDSQTGEGVEKPPKGVGKATKFKIYIEGDKTMIDYFLTYSDEKQSGEIIVLDEKEFKVKFEDQGFYTIQERAKNQ